MNLLVQHDNETKEERAEARQERSENRIWRWKILFLGAIIAFIISFVVTFALR